MYVCTPSATVCAYGEEIPAFAGMGRGGGMRKIKVNKEIPAFAGMAALFVFADNTEFGGTRKYKKPPFRRKNTAIPAKVYPR
ncbi:MAG: hypothetical protein ACR2QC_10265 [Gammaproteobacteria bacterium]